MQNSHIKEIPLSEVKCVLLVDESNSSLFKISKEDLLSRSEVSIDIVRYAGIYPPIGVLPLNGDKYYLKTDYPDLFNIFGKKYSKPDDPESTFRLPDLSTDSRFILGVGLSDDEIPFESFVEDTIIDHTHVASSIWRAHYSTASSSFQRAGAALRTSTSTGGEETAPKSIALNFGIRSGNFDISTYLRETTLNDIRNTTFNETRIIQSIN